MLLDCAHQRLLLGSLHCHCLLDGGPISGQVGELMEHLALADNGEGQGRVAIKLVLKYNKYS